MKTTRYHLHNGAILEANEDGHFYLVCLSANIVNRLDGFTDEYTKDIFKRAKITTKHATFKKMNPKYDRYYV